jgi:hypothetical protein
MSANGPSWNLLRLKKITGVVGLVTKGDSNRPSDALSVDDFSVQGLMKDAEAHLLRHSKGIGIGSFVRVLNGETRDFCGRVEAMGDGKAVVRISLKTRNIILETPLSNLLNLSDVPEGLRSYYYCALVESLRKDEQGEGEKALPAILAALEAESRNLPGECQDAEEIALAKEDIAQRQAQAVAKAHSITDALSFVGEDAQADMVPLASPISGKADAKGIAGPHSRQKTVTALVKALILIEQINEPMPLAARVVKAIKAGEAMAPKSCFIVCTIIKDGLMRHWFRNKDPEMKTYRNVTRKYGSAYKFSAMQVSKIDASLKLPVGSKPANPKKGNRSNKKSAF